MKQTREELIWRKGFLEGKMDGITDYAIWKNGQQLVGCLETPLNLVLQDFRNEHREICLKLQEPCNP